MRIGIAVSRAANISPTWTTTHLIERALVGGHSVRLVEPWDFEIDGLGKLVGRAWAFDDPTDRESICATIKNRTARRCYIQVDMLDLLLLRINPMNTSVLAFAGLAENAGVLVINRPGTLLKTSHKAYLPTLIDVPQPKTMVSRSPGTLRAFCEGFKKGVVLKPARASGGRGVEWVRNPRSFILDEAIHRIRNVGDGYVVAQEYMPEAEVGEKRLVWLDGEVAGCYLRRRAPGEFRHNLHRGSLPEPSEFDSTDRELVAAITPHLKRDGIWLAGLDIIGGRVVEVNTLNPGGVHLVQEFTGRDVATPMVRWLEQKVLEKRSSAEEHGE